MAPQKINQEIQSNLKKTGFTRINDELHNKTKNKIGYIVSVSKDTPYVIDASNVHPGENLRLKIKGQDGNVIAKATHSHGSNNPHLNFNVKKNQNVKVIIQVEDDKNNKGKIPFNLAIQKFNKIPGAELSTSSRNDVSYRQPIKVSSNAKGKDIPTSTNSVTTLWDQLSANSGDITIKDLDDLMGATTSDGTTVSQDEINSLSQILEELSDHVESANLDY